jgi:hypothetical protein
MRPVRGVNLVLGESFENLGQTTSALTVRSSPPASEEIGSPSGSPRSGEALRRSQLSIRAHCGRQLIRSTRVFLRDNPAGLHPVAVRRVCRASSGHRCHKWVRYQQHTYTNGKKRYDYYLIKRQQPLLIALMRPAPLSGSARSGAPGGRGVPELSSHPMPGVLQPGG